MRRAEFINSTSNLTVNIVIFVIKYKHSIKKERKRYKMSKKDFALLIKSIRLLLMLTQTQMAENINISPQTYKLWELAETLPTPTSLNKLVNAYKVLNVPQTRINDIQIAYQNSKLCILNDIDKITYNEPHNKSLNRFSNL